MAALAVVPADLPQAGWRTCLPRRGNDRVILCELEPTDASALYRLACDPETAADVAATHERRRLLFEFGCNVLHGTQDRGSCER
jgi:hypothetical protein